MDELKINKEYTNESEKSPLESLKERMKTLQSGAVNPAAGDNVSGFTINYEEEERDTAAPQPADDAAHIAKQETFFDEEIMPENEEQPEDTPLSADESLPENSARHGRLSFIKRMRRFTTNDNGVNVSETEKPVYELDPVDKILGTQDESDGAEEENGAGSTDPYTDEDLKKEEQAGDRAEEYKGYISDIDTPENDNTYELPDKPATADTATIRFTPVSDSTAAGASVTVDTMTHQFDLGSEFSEKKGESERLEALEESEFDRYVPEEEINDRKDEKRFLHNFALKKRNRFLAATVCGLLTVTLVIFLLPAISASFYSGSSAMLTVSTVIFGITVLLNGDMFINAVRGFSGETSIDACASAASLSTLALCIFSIIGKTNCFPMIVVCAVLLFIRSLSAYYSVSNLYGNLKVIGVPRPKKAVTLINDDSTTRAMAMDSIEGKVMVASARKADRVADYMKYSSFGAKLFGKAKVITVISLLLALVSAVIAGLMKRSAVEALYISSAILCTAALPIAFFIDVLPLRSAATRLNRIGAMLNGYAGADSINQANAVVIKTSDIYPTGSIVLKDIKVLSKCDADDILLRAASLTDAVSSPLSSIFKQIAKTNAAYDVPDSDTVKYENQLGISGWVSDELMFIGNRTLLEAHGISVPSVEMDHEILKHGFFPVYVANGNSACLMLIIEYKTDPAIARQLRSAAELGITLLIENSDPNVSNIMLCDNFDLYEDSVQVMNAAGASAHRAATRSIAECPAPAAYRGNSMSLLQIMSSAARIKKSNLLLTVIYVIAAVIGTVYFIYNSFLGNASVAERSSAVLIYELAATAISLAAFTFKKP